MRKIKSGWALVMIAMVGAFSEIPLASRVADTVFYGCCRAR